MQHLHMNKRGWNTMTEHNETDGTCPRCGKETYTMVVTKAGCTELIDALCDGCSADVAVERAYAGTDY